MLPLVRVPTKSTLPFPSASERASGTSPAKTPISKPGGSLMRSTGGRWAGAACARASAKHASSARSAALERFLFTMRPVRRSRLHREFRAVSRLVGRIERPHPAVPEQEVEAVVVARLVVVGVVRDRGVEPAAQRVLRPAAGIELVAEMAVHIDRGRDGLKYEQGPGMRRHDEDDQYHAKRLDDRFVGVEGVRGPGRR